MACTLYHMLDLCDQDGLPLWFKQHLRLDRVSAAKITQILKLLESPDQIRALESRCFHKYVLREAEAALDELDPFERSFGSLTATVTSDKLDALKQEINRFKRHLLATYASKVSMDGEVVCVNTQLYSLT